jgi:hypothetical protein
MLAAAAPSSGDAFAVLLYMLTQTQSSLSQVLQHFLLLVRLGDQQVCMLWRMVPVELKT